MRTTIKVNTQAEFDAALEKLKKSGGTIKLGPGSFKLPKILQNITIRGSGQDISFLDIEEWHKDKK